MGYRGDGRSKRTLRDLIRREERLRSAMGAARVIQRGEKGGSLLLKSAPGSLKHPGERLGEAITNALDPTRAPGKVKTFAEMTPEEREEMRRLYEKKP